MKRFSIAALFVSVLFCINTYPCFSEQPVVLQGSETKTVDVNKDGKPDVTYHSDGKYVSKAEADTDFDGNHEVVVHNKDGKFESAEVDTDNNGTMDKKFTDVTEFNRWLNQNNPEFNEHLNRRDWDAKLFKF